MTKSATNFLDLLTPHNSQVIFIDQQPQMAFGVQSIDRQTLKNNVVGLAKAAKVFNVPTTITTVETESFSGHTYPELLAVYPEHKILERTSMNSWDDQKVRDALAADRAQEDRGFRSVDRGLQPDVRALGHERQRLRDLHGRRCLRRHLEPTRTNMRWTAWCRPASSR